MRVIAGTFRLSLVALIGACAYFTVEAFTAAGTDLNERVALWQTLRCGERFLDQDMSKFTNEYGNIDIGAAGCSSKPFLANLAEIREARSQARPEISWDKDIRWRLEAGLVHSLGLFAIVNLLGLVAATVLKLSRWILAGYRPDRG